MNVLVFISALTITAAAFSSGEASLTNPASAQNPPSQQSDVRWKRVNNQNGSINYSIPSCMVTSWKDDQRLIINAWETKGTIQWRQTVVIAKGKLTQDSRVGSRGGRGLLLPIDNDAAPNLFFTHCAEAAKGLPPEVRKKFNGYAGIQ
jgi:hypothetical protein